MTRLIDADALYDKTMFKMGLFDNQDREIFLDAIDEQPTAYDVDKVIEELEKEQEQWLRGYNQTLEMGIEHLWRNFSGRVYGVASAIDIVKRGGVND
ncbi:MAG: hypothetical protein Q4A15_03945 [Prevotellaceae bacterium]|nr:hypothetical protein [Prevotellaceae bacterium]